MTLTSISPTTLLNQRLFGYSLCILPSPEETQEFDNILQRLYGIPALWQMPLSALHITVFDYLPFIAQIHKPLNDQYQMTLDESIDVAQKILSTTPAFTIQFNEIRLTSEAIIIVGEDSGELKRIRNEITYRIELPPQTKSPPAIIHSTLGRFTAAVESQTIQEILGSIHLDFSLRVTSMTMMKHIIELPNYCLEPLASFNLKPE